MINAMRLGASEFMIKPMDLDLLENTLLEAREYVTTERFRVLNEQAREAELAATQVEVSGLNRDIRKAYSEALASSCLSLGLQSAGLLLRELELALRNKILPDKAVVRRAPESFEAGLSLLRQHLKSTS